MNGSKSLIQHPCPQCGGQVTLEDTDRIFQCPYCRVRLVVQASPRFIYVLPAAETSRDRPLIHVPYWRFRGLVFALSALAVNHRILDVSSIAVAGTGLPPSLGLRPQVVTMSFYTPELPGKFIPPTLSHTGFLQKLGSGLKGRLEDPLAPMTYHAFIGENVSLIYAPFFEKNGMLHDALTGRPIIPRPHDTPFEASGSSPADVLQFHPTLCPQCGGDMEGERDALVLRCRTCSTFWETSPSGFHRVEAAFTAGGTTDSVWAPFWVLEVTAHPFSLETFGDFVALTQVPTPGISTKADRQFYFWIPAFKLAPQFFLRAARVATMAQPELVPLEDAHLGYPYPVSLPSVEAFQACPVLLGALSPAKEELFPKIRKGRLAFRGKRLAYLPLRRLSSEWVLDTFGIAFPLHALRWGRAL